MLTLFSGFSSVKGFKDNTKGYFKDNDVKSAKEFLNKGLKELGVKRHRSHGRDLFALRYIFHDGRAVDRISKGFTDVDIVHFKDNDVKSAKEFLNKGLKELGVKNVSDLPAIKLSFPYARFGSSGCAACRCKHSIRSYQAQL
jgi:hypothetical protein